MIKEKLFIPRGTSDILPEQSETWQNLESTALEIFRLYNYKEIRTPIFEEVGLFARSMGQTSDIVQKQMLMLEKNRREGQSKESKKSYALRPEGTASIVRSYIENNLDKKECLSKFFYIGPMFRGERPQKGRLRQFHQIGAEAIGPKSASPYLDAEIIALSILILKSFGIQHYTLKLNSLGTKQDKENLALFLRKKMDTKKRFFCPLCQDRFERNVFRILDCKKQACQDIVGGLDLGDHHLSEQSQQYYQQVRQALDFLEISYKSVPTLVRGLDYYTQTVFEITSNDLGSQDALGAGGRYDQLVYDLGGSQGVDAVGFSLGIERILLALSKTEKISQKTLDVFIVSFDQQCFSKAFALLQDLRKNNISSDVDYRCASIKNQMRLADKLKAKYVMILGQEEISKGFISVKDMKTGDQRQVPLSNVVQEIKGNL